MMIEQIAHLQCLICGKTYPPETPFYVCPEHGNEGILDVVYDYAQVAQKISRTQLAQNREQTMWRYRPILPVSAQAELPPLTVGGTPLYRTHRLSAATGLPHLWLKDDGRQPTASFKDRASALAIVKARERQAEIITTASTGNAAAALSGLCASVGQANVIFVPHTAPPAKIAQLLTYGSKLFLVEGSYDEAFELCLQSAEQFGWYNRNTGYNPYMTEGKKTVSFEICEQLQWNAPDLIFVSVGDGCIIGGVHKGLSDLLALGWIEKMPRLIGVQAQGSNFLAEAWQNGESVLTKAPISAQTVADSIRAGLPRDRLKAMRAVQETGGAFVTVSDEAILAAIPQLAQLTGVFAEPAGAASLAGLLVAQQNGLVSADDRIVLINTGNGLKDISSAMRATADNRPIVIPPTLSALQAHL